MGTKRWGFSPAGPGEPIPFYKKNRACQVIKPDYFKKMPMPLAITKIS